MYPSAEAPHFGIFVANHVYKMETEHGIEFELAVSRTKASSGWERVEKYLGLYARALTKLPDRFDLVHLHYPSPAFLPAALPPALLRKKPLVVTSHGGDVTMPLLDGARRLLVSQILRRADAVIAVSRAVARRHEALGVPNDRLHVIDMGCDLSLFTFTLGEEKKRIKRELGLDPDRAAIMFAGDLIPRKACDLFLDALAQLPESQASAIIVAGDGSERARLEQHPLASRVKWLGFIPQREVARWLAASDVFIFPTRDEPLGLVALEAMASGTPVIATRVGGVPEIIEHEKTGLLFEMDRSDQIAAHVRRLLGDPALRERLGRAGLETAKEHALDRQVARVVEVYRQVLAR